MSSESSLNVKSVIEYHGEYSKTRCGYCKNSSSSSSSISTGFVAHFLTVFDYERCINNGWRRSGRWVYHPTPIQSNCCVLCTIRLNVERFQKTSKQKRVERKFERYLETGFETSSSSTSTYHHHHHRQNGGDKNEKEDNDDDDENRVFLNQRVLDAIEKSVSFVDCDKDIFNNEKKLLVQKTTNKEALERGSKYTSSACLIIAGKLKKDREEVVAKVLKRLTEEQNEMKHFRVEARGGFLNFFPSSSEGNEDSFEKTKIKPSHVPTKEKEKKDDHPTLKPQKKTTSKHKMFTVTVENSEFRREDFELWQRYQAKIHNDPPSKLKKSSYVNFLCDTPLVSDDKTYGSKHFRYFIDDKLVAVGVCDVLPTALSSVYFYHDPDLMKLELGKLSALYEIDFVSKNRNTAKYSLGDFKYYYMGYYIHDCQKMRYKGEYKPSELRCPTTGKWVSLDDRKTLEKLDAHSFKIVSDVDEEKVSMKEEKDEFEESSLGNQIVGVIQNGQYLGPTRIMENGAPIYHVLNASNSGQKKLRMIKQFRRDIGGGENEFVYLVDVTSSRFSSSGDSEDDDDDDDEDELLVASPSSSDAMSV